jgi:hypothetical protein
VKYHIHVLDKLALSTDILETIESDLGDDGAEFTTRSSNTVSCRSVSCRERFAGDDLKEQL